MLFWELQIHLNVIIDYPPFGKYDPTIPSFTIEFMKSEYNASVMCEGFNTAGYVHRTTALILGG